jgi:hypothetical protein
VCAGVGSLGETRVREEWIGSDLGAEVLSGGDGRGEEFFGACCGGVRDDGWRRV